jgi:hypothetical protein
MQAFESPLLLSGLRYPQTCHPQQSCVAKSVAIIRQSPILAVTINILPKILLLILLTTCLTACLEDGVVVTVYVDSE